MKLIGYYNKHGYRIQDGNGNELYTAGNNPFESSSIVDNGLPIETLRGYCEQTGREMAAELSAEFMGVEFEDEEV